MKKMRTVFAILLVIIFVFSGCGEKQPGDGDTTSHINTKGSKSGDITYTYKDPNQTMDYTITKSVYSSDSLMIYMKFDEDFGVGDVESVDCFDKDHLRLNIKTDCKYKNNVFTIKTSDPKSISGVNIYFERGFGIKLRYLDSEQFAGLEIVFVSDLGFEDWGDEEAFYTEAEKQAERDRQEGLERENKEAIKLISAHWVLEGGETYLDIYESDGTVEILEHFMENGEEVGDEQYYIQFFRYYYDEDEDIYYLTGQTGEMTAPMHFEISNDKTVLKADFSDKPFIKQ